MAGVTAALAINDRQLIALCGLVPLSLGLGKLVASLVQGAERRAMAMLIALAFTTRTAVAVVLYSGSTALGMGGFTSGDDRLYADAAWYVAQFWKGTPVSGHVPPDWGGYAFLLGTYTYLSAVIYYILGFQLLLMDFINCALGTATIVLLWDITRRVFGPRPAFTAALLLSFLPSLVVFSAVNLKDALSTFLVAVAFWSMLRFQLRPNVLALLVAYAALEPIRGIRTHIFVGVAGLLPFATALTPDLGTHRRLAWSTAAITLSVTLLVGNSLITGGQVLPARLLEEFERVRTAQARGRTAIEAAKPTPVPSVVRVQPTQAPPPRSPSGTATATASAVLTPVPETQVVDRTLAYLPIGLAHALFAPFPWKAERLADVAAIPEVLAWYVIFVGMLWSLWRRNSSIRFTALHVLFVIGLLGLFALVEGNIGTLIRHRALLVPFAIVVASPALAALVSTARTAVSRLGHGGKASRA